MPSGLSHGSVAVGPVGRPADRVAQRQAGEALRDAHASFSLVRVRKSSASTPIARGVVGASRAACRR